MTDDSDRWLALLAEVERDLRRWRRAHPAATLTEIEAALAVEWGRPPRAIPVPQLQELLVRQVAYLGRRASQEPAMR
ncbi:MAG: hypothetical protein ACRDJH_20680 [Thermomicrobiales bacterium]